MKLDFDCILPHECQAVKHLPCVYTRYYGVEYVALELAVMTLSPPATSAGGHASTSGRDSVQRSDVAFVQCFNWVHGVTQTAANICIVRTIL